ncbi:MAG: hypothetical protein WBP72_03835 [Rhodocyclaceae bacterium]
MRTKSKWFDKGRARGPEELAGPVAMTLWRLSINTLRSMRRADYDIVTGPPYFDFLREYLVFLANLADRYAFPHFDVDQRGAFMSTLVLNLGQMLAENESELLGRDLVEAKQAFVDLFNARGADYAHFEFGADGPEYGFLRYCGNQLLDLLPEKDRFWVVDQVISIEAPEAVKTLGTAFANLFPRHEPQAAAG